MTTPDSDDWRLRERDAFHLLLEILHDRVNGDDSWTPDQWRRAGYLAAVARHLLGVETAHQLEDEARARLFDLLMPRDALPLVPGSRPRTVGLDELASAWGISPGIDMARFRAERTAIEAEMFSGMGEGALELRRCCRK